MLKKQTEDFFENIEIIRDFLSTFTNHIQDVITKKHFKEFTDELKKFSHENKGALKISDKEEGVKKITVESPNKNLMRMINRMNHPNKNKELVFKSTLINLISSAEWYFSNILHIFYEKYPNAINDNEKYFGIKDLQQIDSISDAKTYIISKNIESTLRASYKEWISFCVKNMKLKVDTDTENHEKVELIFKIRNLYVHNNGIVNNIFLHGLSEDLRSKFSIQKPLSLTPEDLEDYIDTIEYSFISLAHQLWIKIEEKNDARRSLLLSAAYEHMKRKKWKVAENLYRILLTDKCIPDGDRLLIRINYWLTLKRQKGVEEIRKEVEALDTSAASDFYQTGKSLLLDTDYEECKKFIKEYIRKPDIKLEEILEWPILEEFNRSKMFHNLMIELRDEKNLSAQDFKRLCTRYEVNIITKKKPRKKTTSAKPAKKTKKKNSNKIIDKTPTIKQKVMKAR